MWLPQPALVGERVRCVGCGDGYSVVATEAGGVWSWGGGAFGRLGHGDVADKSSPAKLEAITDQVSLLCNLEAVI